MKPNAADRAVPSFSIAQLTNKGGPIMLTTDSTAGSRTRSADDLAVTTGDHRHTPWVLLVDGENVDWTLSRIINRKPMPNDRPRWECIPRYFTRQNDNTGQALFFLNAARGVPKDFARALAHLGYRVVPVLGPPETKVVDAAIKSVLRALCRRDASVILASHDGDFVDELEMLADGKRSVSVLGFSEMMSKKLTKLVDDGRISLVDLEKDVRAFRNGALPRFQHGIALADLDPESLLESSVGQW